MKQKKKLLLVTGAGASLDFGMPSVREAAQIINDVAQTYYPLADRPDTNLYQHVEGLVNQYWSRYAPRGSRREAQFEDVLYAFFGIAAAHPAGAYTAGLGALIEPKNLPAIRPFRGTPRAVNPHDFSFFGAMAVDGLLEEFRGRCKLAAQAKTREFECLQSFVAALQTRFEIAVVTVNYDNVLYRTLLGIETGFDHRTRRFNERRIFERKTWPCMLHLHGSVHFDMPVPNGPDMHEIVWQPDINATFAQNAAGRGSELQFTPEGAGFPTSAIVAGYGKTTQILRRPFRTYYSELDRLVSQCDAVLIAGYGFGDAHLNIAFEQFRDARRRPVVLIHKANKGDAPWGWPDVHGPIAKAIIHTFHTEVKSTFQSYGNGIFVTVDNLLEGKDFATSNNSDTPLAVWYNGILQACENPEKVIAVLERAAAT